MPEIYITVEQALLEADPRRKCAKVADLQRGWLQNQFNIDPSLAVLPLDEPGRPTLPQLVDPRKLERRSAATETGRIRLLHAFAHIEFNAINIALDAVYRFRDQSLDFITDWLQVASEEAKHFCLLDDELLTRGSGYGAHLAHAGLWQMVCRTRHDVLHRMALVPRIMEARGLDVTPTMIEKFEQVGDLAAAEILRIIYRDEVGHVRIGNHWYHSLCAQRGLDPVVAFQQLVDQYMGGKLRGPFNWLARLEAGFGEPELEALERAGYIRGSTSSNPRSDFQLR